MAATFKANNQHAHVFASGTDELLVRACGACTCPGPGCVAAAARAP